jgi:protein O-GlcNAc transferase
MFFDELAAGIVGWVEFMSLSGSHPRMIKIRSTKNAVSLMGLFTLLMVHCLDTSAQASLSTLQQADAAYRAGQAALSHQDLATAQVCFERVVRLAPSAEQGHSALGAVLVSRGSLKEGIHELEAALAIKKDDSTALMNLAMGYQKLGLASKANPLFSAVESKAHTEQRNLPTYFLAAYARSLVATGRLGLAVTEMQSALRGEPQNAELHDELGSIYAQQKHWADAQREFADAVTSDPKNAMAHLHLALTMEEQHLPDAQTQLLEAARLAPANPVISFELGKAFASSGADDRAIAEFQKTLHTQPENIDAMYELALALQRSAKVQDALSLFQKVVAAQPENAPALTNLGLALTQSQHAKDAVPFLERSIALVPENVTAHQNLAAAYVQLSQFTDAVAQLRTAVKWAPDSPQVHYDLGLTLKMQDATSDAIPELEAAARLDPTAPEAPYVLGVLYMQTGRYEDAAKNLTTSLRLRPENGDGWAMLGSVETKLNLLSEATESLRKAIVLLPQQPDPHLSMAAILMKQNKVNEAVEERRKAADLMRTNMDRQRAEVATNAGNSLLKNGDLAGAEVQFRDALRHDPKYAEAHLGLARIFDSQGKAVDAAAERQQTIAP